MSLPPLVYGKIVGRYVAIIADTPADPDLDPDAVPMSGKVTITPSPSRLLVATAEPVPTTVVPTPIVITLDDDGYISHGGVRGVYVLASNDPSTNPTAFSYRVSFDLQIGGVKVPCPSFDIEVPAGGVVDLTRAAPIPGSPGSAVVRGPEGPVTDLVIGTVTTLPVGEPATASITGEAPFKALNIGLPVAEQGSAAVSPVVVSSDPDVERPDVPMAVFLGMSTRPTNMLDGDFWGTLSDTGDVTAPTVPSSVTISGQGSTGFTVSWTASTDAVGVTGYDVQIDGVSAGTPSGTSLVVTGKSPSTGYSVRVRARDAAGNWSALSTAVTATTTASPGDTTPPSVPTGLTISGQTATGFTASWTASTDAVGVTAYEVQVDGVTYATPTGVSQVVTGRAASTTYAVRVRARDAAGNWSAFTTAVNATTTAAAAPRDSVFGAAAHPGTFTSDTDGPATLATRFRIAQSGKAITGARIWKPAGVTIAGAVTMKAFIAAASPRPTIPSTAVPGTSVFGTISALVDGWNEVTFATPLNLPNGATFWIGATYAGTTYVAAASTTTSEITSTSLNTLFMAEEWVAGVGRSQYQYSANGYSPGFYGFDVLIGDAA